MNNKNSLVKLMRLFLLPIRFWQHLRIIQCTKEKGGISMFTYSCGYATQQLHFESPRKSVSWELVLVLFIVLVLLGQVLCLF